MNTTTENRNYFHAKEIFEQLKASKVNGFPFLAYSGAKAALFSEESVHLTLPKNPGNYKSILIIYERASDLYKVMFYDHESIPKQDGDDVHTDVYADSLVDLIVDKMGIR